MREFKSPRLWTGISVLVSLDSAALRVPVFFSLFEDEKARTSGWFSVNIVACSQLSKPIHSILYRPHAL